MGKWLSVAGKRRLTFAGATIFFSAYSYQKLFTSFYISKPTPCSKNRTALAFKKKVFEIWEIMDRQWRWKCSRQEITVFQKLVLNIFEEYGVWIFSYICFLTWFTRNFQRAVALFFFKKRWKKSLYVFYGSISKHELGTVQYYNLEHPKNLETSQMGKAGKNISKFSGL